MALKHIFISHAGPDKDVAERLAVNLRNAGHDTKVDLKELGLGDDSIDFMNDGIGQAHMVVILFSRHTTNARWQRLEINGAVWNQVAQDGGTCVVVRLDDTKIPPLLGPKVYGKLSAGDAESLRQLVEDLCAAISPERSESAIMAEAMQAESQNPFRLLRAEYFENRPDLHAQAFASPGGVTVGAMKDMKPCFLEGSRGTGKSMLLLSLRARNFILRNSAPSSELPIFGFYLKLSRGAICNAGVGPSGGPASLPEGAETGPLADIAAQEIIIQTLESLFSEVAYVTAESALRCEAPVAKALTEAADAILFEGSGKRATTLDELLERLALAHRQVANYIRRRFIYGEHPDVPFANFDLEQLKRIIKIVRQHLPRLKNAMFVLLLDEYENLFPYQQRIVNGFVKLGAPELSLKIGKKLGTKENSGTPTGQELQEIHDYTRLPLVYDVEDSAQRKQYHELLRHIVENILKNSGTHSITLDELLPSDDSPEVDPGRLEQEIARLCKLSVEGLRKLPEAKRHEKSTYYREAATYRVLLGSKGRRADKRFSGFLSLAFVSSGVIRYFQEVLGVAYHLEYGAAAPPDRLVLPPAVQSRAVHFVSRHNLTTLSRNVERLGESLKYFLLDVGDCLRYKLLRHSSEPEAARLTIEDPEVLEEPRMAELKEVLAVAILEGVFQTKEGLGAFKPKHTSDPQPAEFNISRIYAPVLEISPRLRWRTAVKATMLLQLLNKGKRAQAMQQLKNEMVRTGRESKQGNLGL